MANETLWTGFNGRKLFAERAKNDEKGRSLTSAIDRQYVSNATVNGDQLTLTVSNSGTPGTDTTVQFSGQQNTIEHIYVGPVTGGNELRPDANKNVELPVAGESGGRAYGGLLSDILSEKLHGIEAGAQVNVKPDWDAASGSVAEILNKPEIPTVNDTTITIAYGASSDSFTTNAATAKTITIPTAASASGSTGATGGLMSDTDKENLDWLTSVTPSSGTHAATSSNTVVTQSELAEAIADFGGYKVAAGTGTDMHPDVQNPSTKIIYLVKDDTAAGDDKFNEWIYHGTPTPAWQLIGTTSMDMTGYAKIPDGAAQNHVVLFGNDETLVDSGKVISDLENVITGISVNGTAQAPVNKVVDITVPVGEDTTTPQMDGTAAVGTASTFSRSDHVHPSDTSKQDVLTFNTAYDASTNKAATMADIADGIADKADKVVPAASGNLAALDTNGNLTDSGLAPDDFVTGVKLEGASTALTPDSNGVVTIPNAISTGQTGASNGLMTANQSQMLDQIGAWTWSSAPFDENGMGTETTVNFPFTVS